MFKLPDLPYAYEALQPTMSAETLHIHHDKHHAKYVDTLNTLLKDKPEPGSLEDVITEAAADGQKKVFNNAAQAWNHAFFWDCMAPTAQKPSGDLAALVDAFEGGLEGLKAKFVAEGVGHFGSGWVWLAASDNGLVITSTHDGENLLGKGLTPLFVADLWEHAYYVDYRNDREGFLKKWFDNLANWTFAGEQLAAAKGKGSVWAYPA